MQRLAVSALMCAVVMAGLHGCADRDEEAQNIASAVACVVLRTGTPWWNQEIAAQDGRFHVTLTATPSTTTTDDVIGLSAGAASQWSDLAAIVRFNPQGKIDVRAGDVYTALVDYPYYAGATYGFRFDVDVSRHTYSVWVNGTQLASGVPFRTEQRSVTRLANIASFINPQTSSQTSSVEICGVDVVQDDTSGDGCLHSTAGAGFANAIVTSTSGALITSFVATPGQANMDGVVGYGYGTVDAYNDYAPSIRFWTNGYVEARDYDGYRADVAVPYREGQHFGFKLVIDVPTKTYSVFVHDGTNAYELARGYHFRTQQLGVPAIDHLATIIASPSGTLDTCNHSAETRLFARIGPHEVQPLESDELAISDGAMTQLVDRTGATIAVSSRGGKLAADSFGNIYVAQMYPVGLMVDMYTPDLVERWEQVYSVPADSTLLDVAVMSANEVTVALGDSTGALRSLTRVNGNGGIASSTPLEGVAISLAHDGYALARAVDGGYTVERYYPSGSVAWSHTFTGSYDITALELGPNNIVAFGGELFAPTDFGDGELQTYCPESCLNAYLVVMWGSDLGYSKRLGATSVKAIATNGSRVAVSSDLWTQFQYIDLQILDFWGQRIGGLDSAVTTGEAGRVWMGASGRVYHDAALKSFGDPEFAPRPFLFGFAAP